MIYRTSLLLASTALSLGLTTAASAQDTDSSQIIVTARRVEERLQDVPISITVYNQQQLQNRNVVNASDLAKFTPSLAANNRFGNESSSFAIRGFIQEGPTSPSVGVYFADVIALRANGGTTAGNGAGPGSFFDLQNVQVLKGPQGTLFGRNTTGGAVLLVPQKPTSRFDGYIEGSFGNFNLRRVEAVLNVPVADNFRVRFGIDHQQRDGYLHNVSNGQPGVPIIGPKDFNDVNYTALRLSVVADLTPNLENYLVATWSQSDTHGVLPRMFTDAFAPSSNPANYRAAFYDAQIAASSTGYYNVSNGMPNPFQKIEQWRVIDTATWRPSDTITIKNIASYGEFRQRQAAMIYGDNGATLGVGGAPIHFNYAVGVQPAPGGYNVAQATATDEIQLQGRSADDKLNYQTGVYGEWADPLNGFQATRTGNFADCIDIETLQCTDTRGRLAGAEGRVASVAQSYSKYFFRNYGVYAQGTYKLTDKLSLTAGVRYTSDTSRGIGQSVKVLFPAANTPNFTCANPVPLVQGGTSAQIQADASRCRINRRVHSAKPTWLIDLDYKPIDDVLLYGKYSRGYRQGSINVSSYGLETWGPEKVDTYELGAKTSFHGAVQGTFNVAAFYNDFRNQQLQLGANACTAAQLVTLPAQCPFIAAPAAGIANVGKSRIKGVEVEASISPFHGFNVTGSYAYLDSKILEATLPAAPPPGFATFNPVAVGGAIPLTPRNKFSVTGSFVLPLDASIGKVTAAATYSYQSNSDGSTSSIRSGLYRLPKQHLLNLNLNWNSVAGRPIDLALFATNVTKEKFYTFTPGASFGFDSLFLNEPRMYGVRLKYHFGH